MGVKLVIYKKYGLNIKFECIPERWPDMYYYWFFGKRKNYHYPTDDDIKFFYFTLFKKNGFLFLIICCIIYRNCFLELVILLIKSGITFYLIVYFIYLILLLRKYLCLFYKYRKYTLSIKYIPILIIINNFLNILFNFKKKKKMVFLDRNSNKKIYQVLTHIVGLSSSNSLFICKKFGFQKECTLKNLDSLDFEQLKNYLLNNFFLEKLLREQISKNVKKK